MYDTPTLDCSGGKWDYSPHLVKAKSSKLNSLQWGEENNQIKEENNFK